MQITIQTISGTYVVPPEKEAALVHWLQNNAIKVGSQPVAETMKNPFYAGRQLLSEQDYRN